MGGRILQIVSPWSTGSAAFVALETDCTEDDEMAPPGFVLRLAPWRLAPGENVEIRANGAVFGDQKEEDTKSFGSRE